MPNLSLVGIKEVKYNKKWPDYNFLLSVITTDSIKEIAGEHMHDLSHWFARYISLQSDLDTLSENTDKETGLSFYRNCITKNREIQIINAT